jgi:hypothetical protein
MTVDGHWARLASRHDLILAVTSSGLRAAAPSGHYAEPAMGDKTIDTQPSFTHTASSFSRPYSHSRKPCVAQPSSAPYHLVFHQLPEPAAFGVAEGATLFNWSPGRHPPCKSKIVFRPKRVSVKISTTATGHTDAAPTC